MPQYSYEFVFDKNDRYVLAEDGSYVILSLKPISVGGRGTIIDLDRKTEFELIYNLIGTKSFDLNKTYGIIGVTSKDLVEELPLVALLKRFFVKDVSIEGFSYEQIDFFKKIFGNKSFDVSNNYDFLGKYKIPSGTPIGFENIVSIRGTLKTDFSDTAELEGFKYFLNTGKLDIKGCKKILSEKDIFVKGKKDLRKIILSLVDF
ncbi:MAG: hypothetical protein ACOC56_07180 [Atribacterota bacterium]